MKKMMTAVMALLLMAGTSAFAQENKSVAPPRERPTTEQLARKATDRMTAQLKLTEKQAEQDESHRDEYYNTIVNGFSNASDEIKAKAKELLAATGEPKFSSPNIPAATLRQIADLFAA